LNGQPDIYVGSFIDETDRHRLTEELKKHQLVVQDQTELIGRFLPDRTFSYVNDVYCRLFDKTREELIGFHWHPVAHPDDLPLIEKKLSELSSQNQVVTIENRVAVASGEWRWFQFVNRGVFDADGSLQEVQSVGRDITDLKLVERSLRENEERLDLALLGSGMVMWDWDIHSRKVTPGLRWSEILGYSDQELGLEEDDWMRLIHPSDLNSFMSKISAHLQGENNRFESEHRLKHSDGHWVNVLAFGKISARGIDGAPTRMIGTIQDVTQRKRLNDEGLELLGKIEMLIRDSAPKNNSQVAALADLTKREAQILGLIADGMTSGQIAQKLNVAPNTVMSHRQKMMAKLNLHTTAEVIRFAMDNAVRRQ
jgi:PAS domain S-box-containing protein